MKTVEFVENAAASTGVDGCACVHRCACGVSAAADPLARRCAWWLTAATIGWHSLEAVIAIVGDVLAGSIALLGFGLDSVVEMASAIVIVWRLSQRTADHVAQQRAERRAVRLIALSLFGIAAYVTVDAASALLGLRDEPQRSPLVAGVYLAESDAWRSTLKLSRGRHGARTRREGRPCLRHRASDDAP